MISVCMTSYNGEKFIKQQIDSILSQLSDSDELIISDDGSSDRTIEIIKSYNDSRIKLFNHEKNPSFSKIKYSRSFYYASANFENAINHAKGDYLFLSDQDDIWEETKVEKMVNILKSVDCVHCNNGVIDSQGNETNAYAQKAMFSQSVLQNLKTTPFLGCCMAFRKEALKYILPFPKKCIGHDLWIGCLCAAKNQLVYIDEPLHLYRVHENNVSPSVTLQSKNPLWFKILYRISFIFQFFVRLHKGV